MGEMGKKKQKQIAREKRVKTEKGVLWFFFHMFILLDNTTRDGVNKMKQNDLLHAAAQL